MDALAGSANKVLTGVVDTSFGVLRAFLPGQASDSQPEVPTPPIDADQSAAPWNLTQPRFGLLRRDTHFSIASIAASLPGRSKSATNEEHGQQMIDVPSRPGSSRSVRPDDQSEDEESSEEGDEDEEDEEGEEHDTRSIRSFESMMSKRSRQARKRKTTAGRKSLADRLASVPGLSRLSQGGPNEGAKVCPFSLLYGTMFTLTRTIGFTGVTSVVSACPATRCDEASRLSHLFSGTVSDCYSSLPAQRSIHDCYRR